MKLSGKTAAYSKWKWTPMPNELSCFHYSVLFPWLWVMCGFWKPKPSSIAHSFLIPPSSLLIFFKTDFVSPFGPTSVSNSFQNLFLSWECWLPPSSLGTLHCGHHPRWLPCFAHGCSWDDVSKQDAEPQDWGLHGHLGINSESESKSQDTWIIRLQPSLLDTPAIWHWASRLWRCQAPRSRYSELALETGFQDWILFSGDSSNSHLILYPSGQGLFMKEKL